MNPAFEARRLLRHQRHGMLATHSKKMEGYPFGSIVHYVLDLSAQPIILISTIAEHTRNIDANERVSFLVTQGGTNVQAEARVTVIGDCSRLQDQDYFKARYLRYFPNAATYFDTHDFFFYNVAPISIRFIGGFGKIHWVSREEYVPTNNQLDAQESDILSHMNRDHIENLKDYCRHIYDQNPQHVEMIGLDCDGFDVRADDDILRFDFLEPVSNALEARTALVDLTKRSRA